MPGCRYCGGEVSPEAKVCPHCGQPDPARPGCIAQLLSAVFIVTILYLLVRFGCGCE